MKQTSVLAHQYIKPHVSNLQDEILSVLRIGNFTGNELDQRLGRVGSWKRLSELKRLGKIVETRKRSCTVTGRQAYEWGLVESDYQMRLL